MASSYLFRLGSITGNKGVLIALGHNKRTLQSERGAGNNIDSSRTHLNYALTGDSDPVTIATHAKVQMVKAGIDNPRKNAVYAVEIIYSLPTNRHAHDTRPFFNDCYQWTLDNFAGELLSFDVHLDESAPHAHAVILPLIDGKLQGTKLKGDRANVTRLVNLFYSDVAKRYGLSKSDKARLNELDRHKLAKLVLSRLSNDSVMQSIVYSCVRDDVVKNPLVYAQLLAIELPKPVNNSKKSFIQIMTSKGKGATV